MIKNVVAALIVVCPCADVAAQESRPQSKPSRVQNEERERVPAAGLGVAERGVPRVETVWPKDVARAFVDLQRAMTAARTAGNVKDAECRLVEVEKAVMRIRLGLWNHRQRGNGKLKKAPKPIAPKRTFFQVFASKF